MNTKEEIGKRLRTLLDVLDVKANVFAVDWLGYDSPSKYYNWHNGKFKPKDDFYNELESAVFIKTGKKVNTDWVRRGQGEMFASESAQESPKDPINPGPASDGYNAIIEELRAKYQQLLDSQERRIADKERTIGLLEKQLEWMQSNSSPSSNFQDGEPEGKEEVKTPVIKLLPRKTIIRDQEVLSIVG